MRSTARQHTTATFIFFHNDDVVTLEPTAHFIIYGDDAIIFISGSRCDLILVAENLLKTSEAWSYDNLFATNVAE